MVFFRHRQEASAFAKLILVNGCQECLLQSDMLPWAYSATANVSVAVRETDDALCFRVLTVVTGFGDAQFVLRSDWDGPTLAEANAPLEIYSRARPCGRLFLQKSGDR